MPKHLIPSKPRRGQALVEFAIVALLMYLFLAAILTFGFLFYSAQTVQQAADLGARELSRAQLPASITFEEAIQDAAVTGPVYDPDLLVFDLDTLGSRNFFEDIVPMWPILNQQLASLMIVDRPVFDDNSSANLLRYPGALITSDTSSTGYSVAIPLVETRGSDGTETIRWVPVVEEIDTESSNDNAGINPDPFSLDNTSSTGDPVVHRGIVALRINYPFQSASMSGFRENPEGQFEANGLNPNAANDDEVVDTVNPGDRGGDLVGQKAQSGNAYAGTYGGTFGLGVQGALGRRVRPFRKLISAQAIYRREVFLP